MTSMYSHDRGLTTWGMRDGKQVWRIRWDGRPDMHADVTGPWETDAAFIKLVDDRVMVRLPWKMDR